MSLKTVQLIVLRAAIDVGKEELFVNQMFVTRGFIAYDISMAGDFVNFVIIFSLVSRPNFTQPHAALDAFPSLPVVNLSRDDFYEPNCPRRIRLKRAERNVNL